MSPGDDFRINVKPVEVSVDCEDEHMSSQVTPSVDSVGKPADETVNCEHEDEVMVGNSSNKNECVHNKKGRCELHKEFARKMQCVRCNV